MLWLGRLGQPFNGGEGNRSGRFCQRRSGSGNLPMADEVFHTVDGTKILRSPVDMVDISHSLQGFKNIQTVWIFWISEPSTVALLF